MNETSEPSFRYDPERCEITVYTHGDSGQAVFDVVDGLVGGGDKMRSGVYGKYVVLLDDHYTVENK